MKTVILLMALGVVPAYGQFTSTFDIPPEPTVRSALVYDCGDGWKVQRYRIVPRQLPTTQDSPFSGWEDIPQTENGPHDGDIRCVKIGGPEDKSAVPAAGTNGASNEDLQPYDHQGYEFPASPKKGDVWTDPKGRKFKWDGQEWWVVAQFNPQDAGWGSCPPDQHLHAKGAKFDGPDVIGAPKPVPDGRCHYDLGDQVVENRKVLSK
jgi:hypothetical protein